MPTSGPLNGITVVDLTRVLAGPYCTMVLADLGARVIKVEAPVRGDDSRNVGPFINGKSAYFMSINRGKESIALDLKEANDRDIFEKLLARADVLVENFRAGTMDKLGYGWEILHSAYPRAHLRGGIGVRHRGPVFRSPRVRHRRAGDGRRDEPHRPAGRPSDARRHLDRRHHSGPVHRHRRQRRALPPHADRRGHHDRRRDARLPGRHPRERDRALLRDGRDARARSAPAIRRSRRSRRSRQRDGHLVIAAGNNPQFGRLCEIIGNARAG